MKRLLFHILATLSLLLCLAAALFWAGSYGRNQTFLRITPGPHYYAMRSANGWISLFRMSPPTMLAVPTTLPAGAVRVPVGNAAQVLTVPYWAIAALLLLAPAISVRMYLLRRREYA